MSSSFDLTSEPWVFCRTLSGGLVELSLCEVFERAPELSGLANESPVIDAAVFRLLVAILHRNFGPADDEQWESLWNAGKFDGAALGEYLEKWKTRFDLFHPETPFYQVGQLIKQTPNYENGKKPARELVAEQSAYGAPRELFESRPDGHQEVLSAARAARWLVAVQAFHPGGLLSRDTKNGDPTAAKSGLVCSAAVVSIQGNTLFETLVLNLIRYPSDDFPSTSKDAPAWEQTPLDRYKVRPGQGLLDWYTWQSRRIQLLPNAAGQVEFFVLLAGHEVSETGITDPMCAYKMHDKLGRLTVGFDEDRALWRDSAALYQVSRQGDLVAPFVVRQFAARRAAHGLKLRLRAEGQVPNKASIVLTRCEVLPLPLELLERPELIGYVKDEISRCETAQGELRNALFRALAKVLSIGDRDPDAKDVRGLIDETQALPRFWADMKVHFDRLVESLPSDPDAAVTRFQAAIRANALAEYERAVMSSGTPSRVLKGFVLGNQTLMFGLSKCGLGAPKRDKNQEGQASEETI